MLVDTGYYWSQISTSFSDGMTTADVIDTEPIEKPADGAIDILLVGIDSRTDAQGNPLSEELLAMLSAGEADGELNTDTIIMIRIPNDGGAAVGVSIPRDSYRRHPRLRQTQDQLCVRACHATTVEPAEANRASPTRPS